MGIIIPAFPHSGEIWGNWIADKINILFFSLILEDVDLVCKCEWYIMISMPPDGCVIMPLVYFVSRCCDNGVEMH